MSHGELPDFLESMLPQPGTMLVHVQVTIGLFGDAEPILRTEHTHQYSPEEVKAGVFHPEGDHGALVERLEETVGCITDHIRQLPLAGLAEEGGRRGPYDN